MFHEFTQNQQILPLTTFFKWKTELFVQWVELTHCTNQITCAISNIVVSEIGIIAGNSKNSKTRMFHT